jgi:hypothetical protein
MTKTILFGTLKFGRLELIWDLVLDIWCLCTKHVKKPMKVYLSIS